MTALEVYRNGRKTCTAGLNRSGAVISSLIWSSGGSSEAQHEELELRVSGYITRNAAHVSWCSRRLRVGDEIKVVVVDRARVDRPVQPQTPNPKPQTPNKFTRKFTHNFCIIHKLIH
jgi:hypothetical protein